MPPNPDAQSALEALPHWIEDYNEHHPYKALKMMSPREYRSAIMKNTYCPVLVGQLHHAVCALEAVSGEASLAHRRIGSSKCRDAG